MVATVIAGFSRKHLAQRFAQLGYCRGAEIGVRQAAFSEYLCQTIPDLSLLCVDPWLAYPSNPKMFSQDRQDRNYGVACARLAAYPGVTIRRMTSMEAVDDVPLGSLDFVYIDANHAYPYVRDDIQAWSPRVRPGGMISGDDYDAPGVQQALEQVTAAQGIAHLGLTDDPDRRNRRGQVFTSWFWEQA